MLSLLNNIPKFTGKNADVHNHLKLLEDVVETTASHYSENVMKSRLLPISLGGLAKTWFLSLPRHIKRDWESLE